MSRETTLQGPSGRTEKQLSKAGLAGLAGFIAAFCVVVPTVGAAAEQIDGGLGALTWGAAWAAMTAAAVAFVSKYANPILPTLCGVMVGITAPRPSEEWIRQRLGDGAARPASVLISIVAVAIAFTLFGLIAKRRKASTAA